MPKEDPFAILKQDHKKVAGLLEEIVGTTERAEKTRKELFAEVKQNLDLHAKIEEATLYPMMEKVEQTRAYALEAEEEHTQVKRLLQELSEAEETTEEWTAKVTVMKENLEHHVKEEETEMFPTVEKSFTEEQLTQLAREMAEMHARGQ